jgi:predicted RNase H-like HicB family nuclease
MNHQENQMQYTVFLQTRKDGGYLAWVPTLPVCLSEGNTREETLEKIRDAIKETLTNVVEITKVEVELPQHPKMKRIRG